MLDWLLSRRAEPFDFGRLGADMHAHWLPGIDDGAKSVAESLDMLRLYAELGYTRLIATPHVFQEYYPNTPDTIDRALQEVRIAAREAGIALTLDMAAEYMIDDAFDTHYQQHRLLCLPGTREVLIEFGFYSPPLNIGEVIFRLQSKGLQPIIAHPERYDYYSRDLSKLESFRQRGLKLQVNLLSLVGYYGKSVKDTALSLLKKGWVDYLGTDAHSVDHLRRLPEINNDRKVLSVLQDLKFKNPRLIDANS